MKKIFLHYFYDMSQTTLDVLKVLYALGESQKESFQFPNVRELIVAIIENLETTSGDKNLPEYKRNPRRIIGALRRVLCRYGKEAEGIVTNPLFQDECIAKILQETQNFSSENDREFLEQYVCDTETQQLYKQPLPIDFSQLSEIEGEKLEFVKQRVLRALGEDTLSDIRRAFLLQAMYYTGFGYDQVPSGSKSKSKFGIHISHFASYFYMDKNYTSNILAGNRVIGNSSIMQLIDAIIYYNSHGSLDGFLKQTQSLYGTAKLDVGRENSQEKSIECAALSHRAGRFSTLFLKKLGINFSILSDDDVEDVYQLIISYTGEDKQKIQRILLYIQDYLGILNSSGNYEINFSDLARKTGSSHQMYDNVFGKKDQSGAHLLLLRTIIAISDANNSRTEFSGKLYDSLKINFRKFSSGRPRKNRLLEERIIQRKKPFSPRFERIEAKHVTQDDITSLTNGVSEDFVQGVWNYCYNDIEKYKQVFQTVAQTLGCIKKNGESHFQRLSEVLGKEKYWISVAFAGKRSNYRYLRELFYSVYEYYIKNSENIKK